VAVKARILGPRMPPFTFEIVVALIVLLAVFYFRRRRK
jgi:PGF-CTERM protein